MNRPRSTVRAATEADISGIAALLRSAFDAPTDAAFASREALTWKYFHPAVAAAGPTSLVVENDGMIVAHAGVCRATFASQGREPLETLVIIDWAADSRIPGAGIVAYRAAMKLAPTTFLIGGRDVTWEVISRLGFTKTLEATIYARWVRPVREFLQRDKSGRALMRLGHGLLHPSWRPLASTAGWSATAVSRFDTAFEFRPVDSSRAVRSAEDLNHRLECPTVPTKGYLLSKDGKTAGFALVTIGHWEAKIIDLALASEEPADWSGAYAAITTTIRREPSVCRIRAMASIPLVAGALERNGFWSNGTLPVAFYDPNSLLPAIAPIDMQFFESDLGFDDV